MRGFERASCPRRCAATSSPTARSTATCPRAARRGALDRRRAPSRAELAVRGRRDVGRCSLRHLISGSLLSEPGMPERHRCLCRPDRPGRRQRPTRADVLRQRAAGARRPGTRARALGLPRRRRLRRRSLHRPARDARADRAGARGLLTHSPEWLVERARCLGRRRGRGDRGRVRAGATRRSRPGPRREERAR